MPQAKTLLTRDREQLERKGWAREAWQEGRIDDALVLIRSVLSEDMSPEVAAECYSAEAGFLLAKKDYGSALESLDRMAPFLEAADLRIQGTFFLQRGRAHKNLGEIDSALTDYAGALAIWQLCGEKDYEGAASINLAELYLTLGDLNQAGENVNHALEILPKGSVYVCSAYETKAKILLSDGQVVKALDSVERALELAGDNEERQKEFSETRAKIKELLLDSLVPVVNMADVEYLKAQMVRNALDRANGSITVAAKILGTSHQVIAYTADQKGFERSRRKKSIIKHLS